MPTKGWSTSFPRREPSSPAFLSARCSAILIRKALEETIVRIAVQTGQPAQFEALAANLQALEHAAALQDRPLFHDLDTAFHEGIGSIAAFPGIWHAIQQVKVQIDRYRLLTLPKEGRLSRVVEEHAAVLQAIRVAA